MGYRYSLAFLTVAELSPPEAVRVAAEAGYDHVGLRLLPSGDDGPYPILTDPQLRRQTRAVIDTTGVSVADVELINITPAFNVDETRSFLECGAELGAKNVLVAGNDPLASRFTQQYGAFCELAHEYGLTADLEFMPWTDVPNVHAALAHVKAVNHPAAGILVDALHVQRSDSPFETIAAIPSNLIHYAQVCDAPGQYDRTVEGLIATARGNRMMPGDGDFDLCRMLQALPGNIVISVEVPQTNSVPAFDRAVEALLKTRKVTAKV